MKYFQRLPCPVLVTDRNGVVLEANAKFTQMATSKPGTAMTLSFTPASRIFLETHAWPLLLKSGEIREVYLQLNVDGHRPIPVMTNAQLSELDQQQIVIWLFFIAETRERFEAELLRARTDAQRSAEELTLANKKLEAANARLEKYAADAQTKAKHFASLSHADPLTGIGNRRALVLQASDWCRSAGPESMASLMLIDVDHFKAVNDAFGHSAGDEVLKALARQLTATVRANDLVTRYGGEEFALWLPDTNIKEAEALASRVHANVSMVSTGGKPITVSIGIACQFQAGRAGADMVDELVTSSDAALYLAKRKGRNQTQLAATSSVITAFR